MRKVIYRWNSGFDDLREPRRFLIIMFAVTLLLCLPLFVTFLTDTVAIEKTCEVLLLIVVGVIAAIRAAYLIRWLDPRS